MSRLCVLVGRGLDKGFCCTLFHNNFGLSAPATTHKRTYVTPPVTGLRRSKFCKQNSTQINLFHRLHRQKKPARWIPTAVLGRTSHNSNGKPFSKAQKFVPKIYIFISGSKGVGRDAAISHKLLRKPTFQNSRLWLGKRRSNGSCKKGIFLT